MPLVAVCKRIFTRSQISRMLCRSYFQRPLLITLKRSNPIRAGRLDRWRNGRPPIRRALMARCLILEVENSLNFRFRLVDESPAEYYYRVDNNFRKIHCFEV